MHPLAWLLWAASAGAVALSTTDAVVLAPLTAVAFFVYASCHRPGTARTFFVFAGFGLAAVATRTLLVVLGPIGTATVAAAAIEGLHLATLLIVFGTFNAVADHAALLRLAPQRLHEPALAAGLALSLAPRMIEAVARVREAQRLRGIDVGRLRGVPALAVPVLQSGMEQALVLAESMDARGHGRGARSRYRIERWTPQALATAAVSSVVAVGSFFIPDGSPWLVATSVAFALPGLTAASDAAPATGSPR